MLRARDRVTGWWNEFWFRPASPLGIVAVRAIVCLNALWILLSRPDLPSLVSWPDGFWARLDRFLAIRYFMFRPPQLVEQSLFIALIVLLLLALFGIGGRLVCIAAGLLLYHFAPFENIIWHLMGPYFSGLTLPLLALLIIGFAPRARLGDAASADFRWPLALIQVIFSFNYFSAALSKIHTVGFGEWVTASNIRGMALTSMTFETPPPLAAWAAGSVVACWSIAIITMIAEWLFIFVPFSRRAALLLVPLAAIGHVGVIFVLGIVFLNLPCLLIYLDWEMLERIRVARSRRAGVAYV